MKKIFSRTVWYRIILLSIGFGLALLIGEVGARFYFFGSNALSYEKLSSFENLFRAGLVQPSSINGLNYELKPDLNTHYKLYPFQTDENGMRDISEATVEHNKVKKIAIIGDSFTMGTGVCYEGIYHTVAERRLNDRNDTIAFQLLNFGVSGYNVNEYAIQLKNKVIGHNPDEIVIGFCGYNDHFRPVENFEKGQFRPEPEGSGFWRSYLRRLISIRLKPPKDISGDSYTKEDLQYVERKLGEIKAYCESKAIGVFLIYLAINHKPVQAKQIRMISEKLGIEFIDSSRLFADKPAERYIFNELDGHPNEEAHKLFAQVLVEMLNRE